MDKTQDPAAAETTQITDSPAVDLPRLVRRLCAVGAGFGGIALIVLNLSLPWSLLAFMFCLGAFFGVFLASFIILPANAKGDSQSPDQ